MTITIVANSKKEVLEQLYIHYNIGKKLDTTVFKKPIRNGYKISVYWDSLSQSDCHLFFSMNLVKGYETYHNVSKNLIELCKFNLDKFCQVGGYFQLDIIPEYATYRGVPFGYPKNELGVKLPFLEGRYTPEPHEVRYVETGNQFRSVSKVYATENFASTKLIDAVGIECKTEHRNPEKLDGWGCGFAGGFFIVKQ